MKLLEIGVKIRLKREAQRKSRKELGALIGKAESTIKGYERGETDIPCSTLLDIANALQCEPQIFFGAEEDVFGAEATLRVYTQEDRQTMAGILVKNGYTIRQVKIPREKGKSNYLCLQVKMEDSNLESQ